MFYRTQIKDHVRVPPSMFSLNTRDSVLKMLNKEYDGYISREFGIVINVSKILDIGEGVIIPGDGASYYETEFELLSFKPELQEVVFGRIKDIADFGAFITVGPMEGMIHVSQTMDDFVSFSKDKVLLGKESKRSLKVGDLCKARIIAVSFKELNNPKLGLTMRQPGLGKIEWIEEDKKKPEAKGEKEKEEKPKKEAKGKGKKEK